MRSDKSKHGGMFVLINPRRANLITNSFLKNLAAVYQICVANGKNKGFNLYATELGDICNKAFFLYKDNFDKLWLSTPVHNIKKINDSKLIEATVIAIDYEEIMFIANIVNK